MADSPNIADYFQRIEYQGPCEPTLPVLENIHRAHTTHVPFENLDIMLGRPILLDLPSLEAKLVKAHRGGYCFEQNTLFSGILTRLGYEVTSLAARVRLGRTRVSPRTHMLLLVKIEGRPYLADVGFGAAGILEPVALEADRIVEQFGWTYRLIREEANWVMQSRLNGSWLDQYEFTLDRAHPADYEVANFYTSTFPTSIFRQMPIAQIQTLSGRRTLRNLTITDEKNADSQTTRTIEEAELIDVLAGSFGLHFPAGTRIPVAAPTV
jgi:N-hydroxyarylamine O-acetyltransferase